MKTVKRWMFLTLLAAAAFSVLFGLTADAQANPEANQPEYWCEEGFKVEWDGDIREYVSDSDYALVVIKAGVENYVFENVQEGDVLTVPKGISHIIFCEPTTPTTTSTTVPEETTTTVKEEQSTTTTIGTTTTQTVPPSTTSTTPTTETTITLTTTGTTPPPTSPPITELPFTGVKEFLLPLSIILLSTGAFLLRKTRESV